MELRGRRRWWALGGVVALAAVAVVAPNVWVARSASGQVHGLADAPDRSVAIVLGAGLTEEGRPTPFLEGRLDIARQLYEQGSVDAILVSGDNRTHAYDEPTAMRDHLVEAGVPTDRVVMDFAGRDTYDTCVRAKRIFEVPDAIIVSQSYHVPRAVAVCNAIGLDTVGVGDDSARRFTGPYRAGEQREYLANVKATLDVLSRRDPVLGDVELGITDALAQARTDDK
ncbi:hypothetical protein ASG73_05415 [Janibacter sp. Soil728]|uniref:SanA/YdcF family protein n=1 Tax=Janibacter sp. Soil728 TaxID=1736393 RepID=UPI0006FF9754|nr:ElyC/SanA/YdcF family protein [Janibacter sp. Soil728]KRE38386.1 hypothetical protein ASG73_05415 [Janibacter sp. Soil728]